ncbi:MAG: thiamine-phosphate kinase [Armatimonadota bacterium]
MRLSDIGEEGLLSHMFRNHHIANEADGVVIGVGDDAAVLSADSSGMLTIITTDMLSERVDYLDETITPYMLGWKSVAVNISDIAAMGGIPTWTLVSLGFRPDTDVNYIDEFYRGLTDCIERFGSQIIGGDMNSVISDNVISITQLGQVEPGMLIRRSGAKVGDRILVTGELGQSRAGYELLTRDGLAVSLANHKVVAEAHLMPIPRVPESRAVVGTGLVTSMMDISDGLGSDLPKLCAASGVGAVVHVDMLHPGDDLRVAADDLGMNSIDLMLSGGEDFELLMTVAPENVSAVIDAIQTATGILVTEIGEIVETGIEVLFADGSRKPITKGWEHFA